MRFRSIRARGILVALFLLLPAKVALAAAPKRVLILHSFGRDVEPYRTVSTAFRNTLALELSEGVEFREVALDLSRFGDAAGEAAFVDSLADRVAAAPVDLVVPVGASAVLFVGRNRERLFPETPALFLAVDPRLLPPATLRSDTILITQRVNLRGILEDMLGLRPDCREVVVVFGASAIERRWVEEIRKEFAPFADRVRFRFLVGLPLEQVLDRCAALPPDSFLLLGMFLSDEAGVPFEKDEVLERIHRVANAPLFSYFASDLGKGIIGGRLFRDDEVGVRAGQSAARLLRGEPAEEIPSTVLGDALPVFDARELRRWRIPESRLPEGSIVRFRQPTTWQQYWPWIVGAISVAGVEALLIAGLLAHRARRRGAEEAARDFGRRLIRAQEEDRAELARELHDDVTQRLARLAIDLGLIGKGEGDGAPVAATLRPVRDELARLSEDVHALSYRLHPSILEDLGLAEALKAEADRFSRQAAIPARVVLGELPAAIPAGPALCLFRVAQEALRNVARHAKARSVEISLRGLEDGLQIAIRDDGAGFSPGAHAGRGSLGLTSMRERVLLLGGELDIESAPGRGTTVVAWVPLGGTTT